MQDRAPHHFYKMYYIYVLKSFVDGKLYIGYTDNLKRRFKEHNDGENISTKHEHLSSLYIMKRTKVRQTLL